MPRERTVGGALAGGSGRVKVAHVTTVDLSLRQLLLDQLQAIAGQGYEVVGISAPGPDVPAIEAAGVRHIPVGMTRRFSPLSDLVSFVKLVRVMRRERFAIVHTHTPKPELLGQVAARLAGAKVVVHTLHGFYFHDGTRPLPRALILLLEKIAARFSDVVFSQSREDMETAVRENVVSADRLRFLGNGIDLGRFDPDKVSPEVVGRARRELGLAVGAPVVGFVGRLVEEKGLIELLEAAREVIAAVPGVRFLLVGATDDQKADAIGAEALRRSEVGRAVVLAGRREDMPEMYALMDLLVLPSHREGFPRAVMEASAMGVPCIATDIRGCREAVRHGETGLLVRPRDPAVLAAAIVDLLGDRARAAAMGSAGRALACTAFDQRLVFARVLEAYEQLLA